jgi:hypothetical protein
MLQRAGTAGLELQRHAEPITSLAGHSYLLELLRYELVETASTLGTVDIDAAYRNVRSALADFFARLIAIIDADMGGSGVDTLRRRGPVGSTSAEPDGVARTTSEALMASILRPTPPQNSRSHGRTQFSSPTGLIGQVQRVERLVEQEQFRGPGQRLGDQ